MQLSEHEKRIIDRYKQDEETMILLFAQWCVNHDLDPHELYQNAYPNQPKNKVLNEALQKTVSKDESEYISKNIVITLLQMFGNDDLAFEVAQIKEKDVK